MAAAVPRYRRIGDEPLYCEADPTEALYKGSDDEDYPNPSVRKYKYEAAAVRFLEGKKTFILSATLRGPFDEASGWTNPWQSKGRSKGRSTSSDTPGSGVSYSGISQSVAKLRSIRHSIEDSFTQKATAHASSSCHLPSPESLDRAIQHPYLDEDELVKLESWRSRVAPAKPSIDRFWAPRQASFDSTVLRKRRAQDPGWLKRRAPKRHRTDGDIDDLDDLDTASVLAQGFGMSQNIHQPILPPPEADVEDELNNNIVHNSDNPISPERKSPTRIGILTSPAKANGESDSDDELSGPSQSSQKPRTWRAASTRSQVSSRRQASEARSVRSNASRRFIRQGTATPTAKTVPVVDKNEAPEFETQRDDSFVYRARPKKRASTPGPLPAQQLTSPLSSAPDDISDFTSLGSHDHDAPSVNNNVAIELSSAAEEQVDQANAEVDEDHTGTALIDAAYIDVVPKETPSTPYSGLDQLRKAAMSAFKTAGLSIMSSFTHEAQNMTEREADSTVSGETDSLHTAPSTPLHRQEEPVLPTATFTLKPFADFTSPEQPARRKSRNARISGGHLPSTQSILLDANINPWGSSPRSNKRVSWGILPYESADASSRADETSTTARRAASPPPEQALDDLPTSQIDPFYKHFSVVKNTVKGHRHRILPTASQQVLRSPSPMAMAEAFVIADELGYQGPETCTTSSDVAEQGDDNTTGHMEDNGSDSGDDVADVLMNLDSFIDAMDVEADVKQAKAETKPVVDQENRNPFSAVASFDAGVWDD
ncbi:hypothetical protein HYQ46_007353 [Verticillium longisporum]|nr:hypothetical protein HYQ46_007353 [Verticillium longisporum]